MNYTQHPPKTHFNYVAIFAKTGRVKVGVTKDPKKRSSYYRQEAARHDLGHVWWVTGEAQSKVVAFCTESNLCNNFKSLAIARHREWFLLDREGAKEVIDATRTIQKKLSFALEGAIQ